MKTPPSFPCALRATVRVVVLAGMLSTGSLRSEAQTPTENTATEKAVTLAPFEITAKRAVGYGVEDASSSSRLNLPYIDIPQSISVITPELLNDANITTSRDMIKWVNNVIPRSNGSANEDYFVRGLEITNSYRDGFLVSAAVTRDAALYDRIEFVKGPASAAIGRGEAGGLVNYVTKKPLEKNGATAKFTVASDNYYRAEVDVNRVISPAIAVRVPLYFEDGDGTYGGPLSGTRKYGLGPSLLWNISPATQLALNATAFRHEGPGQSAETDFMDGRDGTIFRLRQSVGQMIGSVWNPYDFPKIPLNSGWGYVGIGRFDSVGEASAVLTHKVSDWFSLRQGVYADGYNEQSRQINKIANTLPDPADPKNFLVPLLYTYGFNWAEQIRAQGDLLLNRQIAHSSNQLVIGYDTFSVHSGLKTGNTSTVNGVALTDELYNPQHTPPPGFNFYTSAKLTTKTETTGHGFGYYGQYLGSYWGDRLKLIAGVRQDLTNSTTHDLVGHKDITAGRLTTTAPRYSLTYKPLPSLSVYYLRSYQEDPAVTKLQYTQFIASNGAVVPPADDPRRTAFITGQLKAKLDEFGIKGNFFHNQLTAAVSYYSLKRDGALATTPVNLPVPTPAFPQAQLVYTETYLTSGEQYKGFEAELYGQVGQRFTYYVGYAAPEGQTVFQGKLSPGASLIRTARVFGKYNWARSDGRGWEFTAGLRELFGNWTIRSNSAVKFLKNQYGVDLGVAYYWQQGTQTLRLHGNNLTDDPQMTGTNANVELRRVYLSFERKW